MAIDLKIEIEERFSDLPEAAQKLIERTVSLTAQELWGQVRKEAPVDHGRLAGSFILDQQNPLLWRVFTNVEYALYVHEGTPARIIEPNMAGALWWEGLRHPVARVHHPGTDANPYADRAIEATEQRIDEFAGIAADEIKSEYDL